MIRTVSAALAHKRGALGQKEKGFTLIELLVVVIIIGILAAIAIPVYLGVQTSAKDSAAKSDLTNAKTAVIALQTSSATGDLPADATVVYPGTTYNLVTATTFCIEATSDSTAVFSITESSVAVSGGC